MKNPTSEIFTESSDESASRSEESEESEMEESEQDQSVLNERKPVTKLGHISSVSVPTPGLKPLREVYNKEKQKNTESYR